MGFPFMVLGDKQGMLRAVGGGRWWGESTLIRESWKFSFPREVMFRLRRLSKKMGKLRCAFRGVWLDGREGVGRSMRSACGGGHRLQDKGLLT